MGSFSTPRYWSQKASCVTCLKGKGKQEGREGGKEGENVEKKKS